MHLTWDQLIKEHGIKNVLVHSLAYPSRIAQILKEKIETLPFDKALRLFDQTCMEISRSSPSQGVLLSLIKNPNWINWQQMWQAFRGDKKATKLLEIIDLELIERCPGIQRDELRVLVEIKERFYQALDRQKRSIEELKNHFTSTSLLFERELSESMDRSLKDFKVRLEATQIQQIDQIFSCEISQITHSKERDLKYCNGIVQDISHQLTKLSKSDVRYERLCQIQIICREKLKSIVLKYDLLIQKAKQKDMQARLNYAGRVKLADEQMIAQQQFAIHEFQNKISLQISLRDERLAEIRREFRAHRDELDQSYLRCLS